MVEVYFGLDAANQSQALAKDEAGKANLARVLDAVAADTLPKELVHRLNRPAAEVGIYSFKSGDLRLVFMEKDGEKPRRYILQVFKREDSSDLTGEANEDLLKAVARVAEETA